MTRVFSSLLAAVFALSCVVLPATAAADGSARDVLFAAYQKMLDSRYAADSVSTDPKGRETHSQVEFDTINRFRATTNDTAIVVLPEGTWMRSGKGEWMQPPIDMSGMFKNLIPSTLDEMRSGTSNIKDEGAQTIDGSSVRVISYDVATRIMGISVASHNTVFIDDSGRVIRSISDGTAMGRKTHTVQNVRYDDSIRISAPN